ncbi:MAG TPA: ShlB/FhaC/HecB family hemolysin secretion/activation protein, partial [Sphingomicrobium sp.]
QAVLSLLLPLAILAPRESIAQSAVDRVDPVRIERDSIPKPAKPDVPQVTLEAAAPAGVASLGQSIEIGAVTFSGLHELTPADFAQAITPYLGRSISPAELSALTTSIAEVARAKGLIFASASVAPQRLTAGILTVHVDEGMIDEVRLSGSSNPAVVRTLNPLVGRAGRMAEVERLLLIAGDIDGITLYRKRYLREGKRGILSVDILEKPQRLRAVLDNDSTSPVGPVQLRLDMDIAGVLAADDSISVTYVTTPLQPDELQYTRVRYSKRIGDDGTEISVGGSVSSTKPGAYLEALQLRGTSWSANISVLKPLQRSRVSSLWFQSRFEIRDSEQTRRGRSFRNDRFAALRVSLLGNRKMLGGTLRVNATLSQGFNLFDATSIGDPLASRRDADATFTSLVSWADFTAPLGHGFSARVAAQSQISSQPLLVSEELGLGGSGFLRGYDYSERSGDEGASGLVELRYDWLRPFGLIRKAQIYGFIDGGRVVQLANGRGGGDLFSGGGGVRADLSRTIDANFEVAVPLSEARYETGNHDPRINLRLLKVF